MESIWWQQCLYAYIYLVKFAVFQYLIVFVCFWVLSLLRRSFWKACVKAVKSLVPQHFCQSTHSHAQTLVLPIKPFSALFHPSATAVLGDTDRERNFRLRLCVRAWLTSGDWTGLPQQMSLPRATHNKNALKEGWSFDVMDSLLLAASVTFYLWKGPFSEVE